MSAYCFFPAQETWIRGLNFKYSKEGMMEKFDREILSKVPENYFFKKEQIRDLLNDYSLNELEAIYNDYFLLKEKTFENADKNQFPPQYVVTAGGPGAGKSTVLENYLKENKGFAYVDPERTCLLHMENTYKKDIETGETAQASFTKWRNASNFIAKVLMCNALEDGYNLAHGAAMTSEFSKFELQAVKNNYGYNRKILHITCPNEIRIASENARRESGIVQCTDEDLKNKGKAFFKRLEDYLRNADEIDYYYRSDMTTVEKVAAKTPAGIAVTNSKSFIKIIEMHKSEMEDEYYWERYN